MSIFSLGAWRKRYARDDCGLGPLIPSGKGHSSRRGLPEGAAAWFDTLGFIGHPTCAQIAQHWLVDKACSMPGRDAIRQGYEIQGVDAEAVRLLREFNKRRDIDGQMREFIQMGRVYGVRIALFKVDSADPKYYERPFNPDGVAPGSYRGIVQVDPGWVSPELDSCSLGEPDSLNFRDPLYYRIGATRYHRSHLAIYVPYPVPDLLKPDYQYGGVSVPQRIAERVFCAEATANEAPHLAMTKRLTVLKTDMAQVRSNWGEFVETLQAWVALRDNYGVKVIDTEAEDVAQFDLALGDLDDVIMTQYQIVAACANVPATKLLGTVPKGFNSTGEYEGAVYREDLESIQANDLAPLLERHLLLAMRSEVAPALGIAPTVPTVVWNPLDSPTAKEWAEINKIKADTDAVLMGTGAIDGEVILDRLRNDPDSGYPNLSSPGVL